MSYWITGPTRSGKTGRLIAQIAEWGDEMATDGIYQTRFLVFALNGDTRLRLASRIASELYGRFPVQTTTPAGIIQDEITLFWPLLAQPLGLSAQFPLVLRPENEQDLASRLWEGPIAKGEIAVQGWLPSQLVRHCLDLLQLAASAAIPAEDLAVLLPEGMPPGFASPEQWRAIATAIVEWRDWCLKRGLVTYGVMTELYWRHLLPHPEYQEKLAARFSGVLADDIDDYPAIALSWFEVFRQLQIPSAYTWNGEGKVRLGMGADPDRMAALAAECEEIVLPPREDALGFSWADVIVSWVEDPLALPEAIAPLLTLQRTARGDMLRATAETVAEAVQQGQVNPHEIAIIAPGLDAIGRYTLAEILSHREIPVTVLNDQRPLNSSPIIRALLTLLTFIYPGLGQLCDRDAVAEMIIVLSQRPTIDRSPWVESVQIDPVRAQLIVDHCFEPGLDEPKLLPVERFPSWDRLGHRAAAAYEAILAWIGLQKEQRRQRLLPSVLTLLDRAIQQFFWGGGSLPYDQVSALRELMETAQRYWDIAQRLKQFERTQPLPAVPSPDPLYRFIQLLLTGAVSANPFPVQAATPEALGVTIATVFQYRTQRLAHRWHFWLDAGSPRWLTGTDALFGFPIFLASYRGHPWTIEWIEELHQQRLRRILRDLLGRVRDRVILCHSDLAVNGQEQLGPLLTLVNAAYVEDAANQT